MKKNYYIYIINGLKIRFLYKKSLPENLIFWIFVSYFFVKTLQFL